MYLIRGIGNIEAFKKKFPNQTMSGTIGNVGKGGGGDEEVECVRQMDGG